VDYPAWCETFSSSLKRPQRLRALLSLLFNGYWGNPRVKPSGREVNHSSPSNAEVNKRSYTPTPPIRVCDVDEEIYLFYINNTTYSACHNTCLLLFF
jgi:hypothetical protein